MRQYPDLNSMLSTCRKDPTQKDHEVCVSTFPAILQHCLKHGHVPDDVLEDSNIPKDRNITGDEVRRTATIRQESHQRAKCLTHQDQIAEREARLNELIVDKKRVLESKRDKLLDKINANKDCVKMICDAMKIDTYSEDKLADATLEHFSNCSNY